MYSRSLTEFFEQTQYKGIDLTSFSYHFISCHLLTSKNYCLRFQNEFAEIPTVNNTIEFRSPNGTLEPWIWQNHICFFLHLLLNLRKETIRNQIDDLFKQRKILKNPDDILIGYENICELENARAPLMADLVFDSMEDKVYFLKQFYRLDEKNKVKTFWR